MIINIKGSNFDLTPSIKDYVNKKLESINKLIDKNDSGAICDFEVGRTTHHHRGGDIFRAEINLQTQGETFYSSYEEEDLYTAIDKVKDEIKNRLSNVRNKKRTLFRRGASQVKNILKNIRRK